MGEQTWLPAAPAAEITTRPRGVVVGGVALVLFRPAPDEPAVAFPDHCPHRLVPLSAATPVDGRLRCAYHGWEFDAGGRCVTLPSAGPQASVPPRAHLATGVGVREVDGMVLVDPAGLDPPEVSVTTGPPALGNEHPALTRAWHPVALTDEVHIGGRDVRLLGRDWTLWRIGAEIVAEPAPYGIQERWGLVWLAPEEPLVDLFQAPDSDDAAFAGQWLAPVRTPVSAGVVADNFLDVAHFPFVHAGTFGAEAERVVERYEVSAGPDGFDSVQVQWFDNPADPGVAQGLRDSRQRRRATYVYRAPFQLMLRLEELDAGAVKTILFFSQPEHDASTRLYTKMLIQGIGGEAVPGPEVLAREVAFEDAVLGEDLALQRQLRQTALPLRMADELHVRADQLGIALRRTLTAFLEKAGQA